MDKVLYRDHRPKKFKDIVGQSHIVSLLEKSLDKGSVGHAYLFSGSRGTGKTSLARIFSRELGCDDIDIFEIDAASNTSVENIRDLNESVYTLPISSEYKVYILDEAHMLSKAAFNAFLKTLEEPPAYAIFILATTEQDKIPETVVSRCISLNFHTPQPSEIADLIKSVAKKEGFTISDQAQFLIALIGDGSFRDALSQLQKVLLFAKGGKIDIDLVEDTLGAPKHELINQYLEALCSGDVNDGIDTLNKAAKSSVDMLLFSRLCIRKLRATILKQNKVTFAEEEYNKEDREFIDKLSKMEGANFNTLKALIDASLEISKAYIKQIPLELLLIREVDRI